MASFVLDIETTSRDPSEGVVTCIGLINASTGEITQFCGAPEQELLMSFLEFANNHSFATYFGYNIIHFDDYFIKIRSLVHSLPVRHLSLIDIMTVLSPKGHRWKQRSDWCKILNIPDDDKFSNSELPTLFKEGRYDEIRAHNANDLRSELEILRRLAAVGLVKGL